MFPNHIVGRTFSKGISLKVGEPAGALAKVYVHKTIVSAGPLAKTFLAKVGEPAGPLAKVYVSKP